MPVPKFRTSRSKRNMRRSHHALKAPASATCTNCKEPVRPHIVCGSCGHYKGRQVMEPRQMAGNMGWDGEDFTK